jgi:photosynthetic reaction center H subunit
MAVFDVRWRQIGIVADVWIDRGIRIIKHLEVELRESLGGTRVLVPIFHVTINETTREIRVTALSDHEFGGIPVPASSDRITAREEDQLNAYFAAGRFYRDMPDSKKFTGIAQ